MPGGRIDVEVAVNARNASGQMQRALAPAMTQAKAFAGAMGLAIGGAAVAAGVKEIIDIGNDYTTTMNTLQAVTRATESQMSVAGDRAKELGNDISLPGTSASDAAAAMTELAKGGFSVQQSMDAAKGTLQLAAAAQIDAATAATIQSQALQSFGLNADYAAKISDVLANSANASSAEITDVASGLQQSGAVANQFGMSIEDTAATLGILANAGIQGSDAGTLLKSSLLALTDQSKPAQGAIEDLGLTVYNAQGQFVGMSSLFGQLDEAAASMTPELYQAATATLFGSDAMRLAGVAAEQGQAGYDSMRTAIDRQGSAAEVAAAKTQGLPGAMAAAGNAAETMALEVYDLVDGPLEGLITKGAEFVSNTTPGLISGLESAGQAMAPVAGFVGDLVSAFTDLPGPVQAVAVGLAALKVTGLDDSIGNTIDGWRESIADFRGEMEMQSALAGISDTDTANPISALTGDAEDLAGALEENAEPLSELASGLAALERRSPAVRNMAEGYRGVTARTREFANQQRAAAGQSGALTSALRNGAARAAQFGGVVGGTAVAGLRGMTSAAKGAIGVLGGPWMVGIMAATFAVGKITSEYAALDAQQEAIDKSSSDVAAAQRDVAKAFQESQGAVSDNVLGAVGMQIDSVREKALELADNGPGAFGIFAAAGSDIKGWFSGVAEAGTDALHAQEDLAEQGAKTESGFRNLGKTNAEVAAALAGSDSEYDAIANSLRGIEDGGSEALDVLQPLREEFVKARDTAKNTTPGFFDLRDAVKVLSDESSSATDRINAMKTALDVLSGKPIPLSDALQTYNDQVRATAEATKDVWDAAEGWGDALIGQDGAVNTASSNGSRLRDSLLAIKDATITAAEAGADMGPIWASNDAQLQQLSISTGVSVEALRRMIEAEGLIPKNIDMLAQLRGADTVEQQLSILAGLLTSVGQPVDIPVDALTDDAKKKILEVGGTIENDINGKPGIVRISAPNQEALDAIRAINEQADFATRPRNAVVTFTVEERRAQRQFGMSDAAYADLVSQLPGRATGGALVGPGTATSDSMLMYTPGFGAWRGSTGEHVLDAGDVQAMGGQENVYRFRQMLDTNALPMADLLNGNLALPGFAEGGALDRVFDLGRRGNGNPYARGGASVSAADCSGWVAILQKAAMGQGEEGRLGTTYSLLAGEWPGLVPGTTGPFVVGTSEEHMAATVTNNGVKVNFESGGANGNMQMGGGAAGAFDPQFTNQYYLPWELFAPPYDPTAPGSSGMYGLDSAGSYTTYRGSRSRKATWAEKDELALESARIAITQAEEDLAAALGNPKKSDADKAQARSKVDRAKQKVKDLEAKKEAASRGLDEPPAPQAPELTTNFSDEELSAQDAKAAVVEANLRRNEVYADPESTPEEKAAADRALQRARNAEAKESAGGSGSGTGALTTPDQWSSAIGGIVGDFVTENVADVLGYYGADNMGPLAKAGVALVSGLADLQKQHLEDNARLLDTAKPATAEELDNQLPATPGTPDWIELLAKGMVTPTPKLFDTGGLWKHGELGLNLSGQTEEVLTGSMRTSVAQELALARAERMAPQRSAPERREARPITVNAKGFDRHELAAGIRQARHEDEWFSNSVRIGDS
ncbi:phage tail tape measure protein [Rhodococcus sp. KRD162]|uniref:phage tail tape measure protein n=1 Tax=Rhodococcus sp. KRD162 TaxID=2729725 RepID=UPI0027DE047E|nr:phage tail tape measure protein [Rhodococcus sp. KRD162]